MKAKVSRGAGFKGLLRYMLDEKHHEHSLKNPEIVSSNLSATGIDEMAAEFGLVRRLRPDIEKPVFHTSLALPAGEALSAARWDAVVRDYLVEMGLDPANHQYVAVIHRDTEYQHVHIAANRIGLDGKVWLGRWEARRAIAATQVLERKHGLRLTKGLNDVEKLDRAMSEGEFELSKRTGAAPPRLRLAAMAREVRDCSTTLRQLVDGLAARGVTLSPNGLAGSVSGASFRFEGVVYSGSRVAKDCAWKALSSAVNYDLAVDADLVAKLRAARDEDVEASKDAAAVARDAVTAEELVDAGRQDLYGARSVITMTRFEKAMAELHEVAPTFADTVSAELRAELQDIGPGEDGVHVFTIKSVIERERRMIDSARLLATDIHHDLTPQEMADAIYAKELEASKKSGRIVRMTDEQKAAVRQAFKGGFATMQGSADAGKSFAMEAVRLGYEERGYQVLGAAIAKRAAQNLEEEAGIRSYTVAKLLSDINGKRIELDRKTVIVVDEAGQVGVGYLAELVQLCERSGSKVVFTGEDRQLDAIQHGGALRFLSRPDVIGTARIQSIQCQNEAWARQAVADYRDGDMAAGLAAFEARGLVHWQRGGIEATRESLVNAWRSYELANPDKASLILAHSNDGARGMGALVREIRKAEGRVTGPDHELSATHGGKSHKLVLAQGDRIRFGFNNEDGIGAMNGTLGTLRSIRHVTGADGKPDFELTVATDDRGELHFRASEYSDESGRAYLNQAYAMTVYSSQGVTVKGSVFVLQTEGMDRAHTYVASSRAKDDTLLFVDRDAYARAARSDEASQLRAELLRTMGREGGERLATEVLVANNPGYLARTHSAGVDAGLRAARDAAMAADEVQEDTTRLKTYDEVKQHAISELYGMEAVATRDRFGEVMAELTDSYPDHAERVRSDLDPMLLFVGLDDGGRELFTMPDILARETQMIRDARTLAMDRHHDLDLGQVMGAIAKKEADATRKTGQRVRMTDEQAAGVAHALRGGYSSLQGSAGAGKSFAMEAVRIGYEDKGYRVLGAAVAKRAAQNLQQEAGIESFTIAKLLKDIDRGHLKLDHKTCLVVDEAGQAGSGYLSALVRHCRASGSKIVLTGEDKQLDAIQHGGVLRFLSREDVIGTARIQSIQRQTESWARQAVADYRDGEMDAGLQAFEERGLVHWVRGGEEETKDRLIKHWHAYERANPDKATIILAHSNVNARALGERVRAIRRGEDKLAGEDFKLRGVHGDKAYDLTLAQGDRVRFTLNDEKGAGVINGTLGTITGITPLKTDDGKPDFLFRVRTDDRGELSFKASEYCDEKGRLHMNQAYAMTVYSAQGVTVKGDVFVHQTPGMDRAHTYVANSRAKDNTHTFIDRDMAAAMARVDDQNALRRRLLQAMSRDDTKKLATELLAANNPQYIARTFGRPEADLARKQRFALCLAKREEAATALFTSTQGTSRYGLLALPSALTGIALATLTTPLATPRSDRSSDARKPRRGHSSRIR